MEELQKTKESEWKSAPEGVKVAEAKTLSYGEKAVGISFNPGDHVTVNAIKESYARIINVLNDLKTAADSPEAKAQFQLAIRDTQVAQMWAVKAITWQY